MGTGMSRKRRAAWAGIAALFVASPAAALQPLDEFLGSAMRRNADELESAANLAQQSAQSDAARGRLLPGLGASGSYIRNQYESQVAFPIAGGGLQLITITPHDQLLGTATLSVPLVDLANFRRLAAAKSNEEGALRQLDATHLRVQGQVVQDYYQLVANIALVAASQEALAVSRESLRLAATRFAVGAAAALDVDRARRRGTASVSCSSPA